MNGKFSDVLEFIKKFDKVIIAYVIFIFSQLGIVLAIGVKSKVEMLGIISSGVIAGILVAIITRKNRISFIAQNRRIQGRTLYIFQTGIYNITNAIEEYYSFKDLEDIRVCGENIILNFEIGEVIVVRKDIFENNKEYFIAIEEEINKAMGMNIEKVASAN